MLECMIKDTDGENYENLRSIEQNFTFETTNTEFSKRNVIFEVSQMKTLKIMTADGIYTNLGLLLYIKINKNRMTIY